MSTIKKKRTRLKKTDTYYIEPKAFNAEIQKCLTLYNGYIKDLESDKIQKLFQKQVDKGEYKNIKEAKRYWLQQHRNKALSKEALRLLIKLADRSIRKFYYERQDDMEDCRATMYSDLITYWTGFNPEKGRNAFAYYSTVIFTAAAKGWRKLYPDRYSNTISISTSSDENGTGIYSLPSY